MLRLLVQWLLSAFALLVVSNILPGIKLDGLGSKIVRGFHVAGFWPAFWGAVVLALLGMLIQAFSKRA